MKLIVALVVSFLIVPFLVMLITGSQGLAGLSVVVSLLVFWYAYGRSKPLVEAPQSAAQAPKAQAVLDANKGIAAGRVKCESCGIEFAESDGKCWKCGTPIPQ